VTVYLAYACDPIVSYVSIHPPPSKSKNIRRRRAKRISGCARIEGFPTAVHRRLSDKLLLSVMPVALHQKYSCFNQVFIYI